MSKPIETEQIIKELAELFASVFEDELDVSALVPEARLAEDLGMTSINLLYMAIVIEERFGVRFTNDDFSGLRTVADVVAKIAAG